MIKNIPSPSQISVSKAQNLIEPPESVDWRTKNVVTPVKNQGGCGSCWAFSTTGTLESAIAISTNNLYDLSEQQLVDCCGIKGFECLGCNGAWPEWAVNYINSAGIVLQSQYKYVGSVQTCKATPNAKKYLNSAKPWTMISTTGPSHKELQAAASIAPVSVCLDASNWAPYKSGIFSNCGSTNLNHAVLLVGYESNGTWIVKNSWGVGWGDKGYIRLGAGNTCGIAQHALSVNLA